MEALALQLAQLLITGGPALVAMIQEMEAAGSANADTLAKLKAQVEMLDAQRLMDWATADAALDQAAKS